VNSGSAKAVNPWLKFPLSAFPISVFRISVFAFGFSNSRMQIPRPLERERMSTGQVRVDGGKTIIVAVGP
jgi:hypothetical protein